MKNKITIMPMDYETDKREIANWEIDYFSTPGMEAIRKYILENDTCFTLGDLIDFNHEFFTIGDDEKQFLFVAKNQNGEIVGWTIFDIFDIKKQPAMFFQYICIHPMHQHENIGTEMITELILNSEKYTGIKPKEIFTYIHQENFASQNLFKKFNFSLDSTFTSYYKAFTNEPKILKEYDRCEPEIWGKTQ